MKKECLVIPLKQSGNCRRVKKDKKSALVRHYSLKNGKLVIREQHVPCGTRARLNAQNHMMD